MLVSEVCQAHGHRHVNACHGSSGMLVCEFRKAGQDGDSLHVNCQLLRQPVKSVTKRRCKRSSRLLR